MKNAPGAHRSSWWMIGGAWAGLVSFGGAAESPKKSPAVPEPAPSASVAATQRDLDRIRAASEMRLSGLANSAAPRVSVPELRTDSVESPMPAAPAVSPIRGVQPEKNASNWLVDAMAHGARDRDERQRALHGLPPREGRDARFRAEDGSEAFSPGLALSRDDRNPGNERGPNANADASAAARGEKRPAAQNPLANYLGEWLTPQDYALLAPGLAGGGRGAVTAVGTGYNAALGTGYDEHAASAGLADVRRAMGGEPTLKLQTPGVLAPGAAPLVPGGFGTTRENPFLAGLSDLPKNPAPAPLIQPPVSVVPPLETGRSGVTLRSPEPPPPAPKVPDLAKPRPDETYFKQLKRF